MKLQCLCLFILYLFFNVVILPVFNTFCVKSAERKRFSYDECVPLTTKDSMMGEQKYVKY